MDGPPASPLRDLVASDLKVLLVAINPAPPSASLGQHFATPSNGFWKLLYASGLTPRLFTPGEAPLLLGLGIGLVSLVQRPTRMASELSLRERRDGAAALIEVVRKTRPRLVAPLGLTLLPVLLPDEEAPGPGMRSGFFSGAPVFVLPNPSGRNRSYPGIAGKLPWYRALADVLREGR